MNRSKRVQIEDFQDKPGAPLDHSHEDWWGFADATGIVTGEIRVRHGEGWYPPMIEVYLDDGSLLPDDCRALGLALVAAANRADQIKPAQEPSL